MTACCCEGDIEDFLIFVEKVYLPELWEKADKFPNLLTKSELA
jgi:hypothetical protein